MDRDTSQFDRAIWHEWLFQIFEDSPNTAVRREMANLLIRSGLTWEHDGPEHREFLDRLREAKSQERNSDVREHVDAAIEALDPEIERPRRSLSTCGPGR